MFLYAAASYSLVMDKTARIERIPISILLIAANDYQKKVSNL